MNELSRRFRTCHMNILDLRTRCHDNSNSNKERQRLMALLATEMTTYLELCTSKLKAIASLVPRAPDAPSPPS